MSTRDDQQVRQHTRAGMLFDIAMGICVVLFVLGIGSGVVFGLWNWLLTSPPLEMSCPGRVQ
jgi:hypothetical protein